MLLEIEALSAFQVLVNTLSVKSKAKYVSTMYISMWQDPFYPYSLLFSSYCIHNYHILFAYIYATSPVSSSSTSSSWNAEEQSGIPSTPTMQSTPVNPNVFI